jgi:hypothetical protein
MFSHENISDLLRTPCKSFKQMHEDKSNDIMLSVHEYIQTVEASGRGAAGAGFGSGTSKANLSIEVDSEGFPISPSPSSWDKTSKVDIEPLYRSYITLHYRTFFLITVPCRSVVDKGTGLASGVEKRQAPFTRIAMKQTDFIASKYLPRGLVLKDPRSMRRHEMIKFFDHIANRQTSHGIKDAFRFKAVLSSRKKGDLGLVKYCSPTPNPALSLSITNDTAPAHVPAWTAVFPVETSEDPAPTPPSPDARPTRPIPTRKGKGPAPAPPQPAVTEPASEPPVLQDARPRPRPRPTGRAKENAGLGEGVLTQKHIPEGLFLDPAYQWESRVQLDPSLEPTFNTNTSNSADQLMSSWDINTQLPGGSSAGPSVDMPGDSPAGRISAAPSPQRRMTRNADLLAREEAERLTERSIAQRRSRR